MKQKTIYSGHAIVRGRMDEGLNSNLYIYNRTGKMLGFYNQVQDKTYSCTGEYVGPGDQRLTLLEN